MCSQSGYCPIIHTLWLTLIISNHAFSQPLHFEKINGLSQSTAYSIIRDKQGFIWIGTGDGLNRYDGVETKVYKPGSPLQGKMSGRIIRSDILEDENERIWFSTETAVHALDKRTETLRMYPLSNGADVANQFANPLLFDRGHLWLASAGRGIFKLDTATGTSVNYPVTVTDDSGSAIQLMYNGVHDNDGNLWFATNQGLLQFNTDKLQWHRYFPAKAFYTLAISLETLYASEGNRVARVPITSLESNLDYADFEMDIKVIERDLIHRIYTDEQLNVWAGDESGNVYCKSRKDASFRWRGNINHSRAIRTNYPVYCFYADDRLLWTGAYMLGLMKAFNSEHGFHSYPKPGGNNLVETVFVNAFHEKSDKELWMGTFQKGIVSLDKETGKTKNIELPYSGPTLVYGKSVHTIQTDSRGNLWTGSSGHLFVMEPGSESFKSLPIPVDANLPMNPQVWCMIELNESWLIGTTVGLYDVTLVDGRYKITPISWLGHSRVVALWSAPDGKVWIAFESGGIAIVSDPRQPSETTKFLEHTNVKSFLYDDMKSILYICTSDGFIAFHTTSSQFKVFAEIDGLTNTFTYKALRNDNELWVSTNAGLFRGTLTYNEGDNLPEATFINFTQSDGLPDNQFNPWAAAAGKSGNFYFGTPQGIVWFNPNDIAINPSLPKIVMTEATANGHMTDSLTAVGYLGGARLPYFMNNMYFRFRGIEYLNPTKVQYSYQLMGWDKEEIFNGPVNEVRYNNLPPGNYTFAVRAANSSGSWTGDPYKFELTIDPPFWNTWWFTALMATSAVSLIVVVTRQVMYTSLQRKLAELERQRELDRERQRISREMHDDIGAGLTQITLISEFARNRQNVTNELEEIALTSRQLVSNMSEIIWSLNPENKSLGQLLSYLREQLNKMLEYSGMDYTIDFHDDQPQLMLSGETTRNLILVTREIVNNAIKHSGATSLVISARLQGDKMSFAIRDDGKGFDAAKLHRGNGLRNIRARVSSIGGQLEIASAKDGSSFLFELPLHGQSVAS
jgi:signal transduction histidine kinase/ligand-binding sensor domain-containing protein